MNNAFTTTASVINDGDYQIINLPEGFQFDGDEVLVQKIGGSVFLTSKADAVSRKPETTD
jgi:virulence-associated protein VagC